MSGRFSHHNENVCIDISPPIHHTSTLPIKQIYCRDCYCAVWATSSAVRKFETTDYKYRKFELDLEFLNNYIKHELIPTFVRFKVVNQQIKNSKVYKDCQMRLLRQEVVNKKSMLSTMSKKLSVLRAEVHNMDRFCPCV